jgi:hypothetical protein
MPIADGLSSGDPISLLAAVVVGSEFRVDAGARPGVVVVASTSPSSHRQPEPMDF